jgi:hypothetical protein
VKFLALLFLGAALLRAEASPSYYPQPLKDATAVYLSPSGGDDTLPLQQAINRVQETNGQGIVFLAPGNYSISNTVYIWPGIRVLGCGPQRPRLTLPAHTPGFDDPTHERVMLFFAGGRPGFGRNRSRNAASSKGPVPDATPGTFYSALANIDLDVAERNSGAVAIRAHYAQHCFLAHMDLHLGPALAGIHEGGNVVEDVHFFGGAHAIWTSKPSPGWQFTLIDCSFEDQREAAILEREAGLTLIRPQFRHVPSAVEIEPDFADELWVKDARLENISGPAFIFGLEKNPRNEINLEGITCRDVPTFAKLRDSGSAFNAPGNIYGVRTFSHGLAYADIGTTPEIKTTFDATPLASLPATAESDVRSLPDAARWVNVRDLGAKGDGETDDTDALQNAIASHASLFFPMGFYIVHDTLTLRPDTALIGLHPGATQIILPDGTEAYQGVGGPKALLTAPPDGSNIVIGIGLYTSGNNRRAVAALWKAGSHSMMNDVRFLGGHGTPLPNKSRENPYNPTHSADPDPARKWDSQYPSLWVTDGGGGTFLDIWTPSTFAQAGMMVTDTTTPGRVYQLSSEHHIRYELQVHHAAHWSFTALQTEEERGESGFALPIEIENSDDLTFANFHAYRVISSIQPFPWTVKVSNSRDIHFRNVHIDSNSKVSFDSSVFDQTHGVEIRQREFASLDISGHAPAPSTNATAEKLAAGFYNISGGAVASNGDFYFIDSRWQRLYRWDASARRLTTACDFPLDPDNLAGPQMVISYSGNACVYTLGSNNSVTLLKPEPVAARPGKDIYLPVSDWRLNRRSLGHPAAQFVSPDGQSILPVGEDFLDGATSWGVKSAPPMRAFGLARAVPGQPFYVTEEADLRTWAADVQPDGGLANFRLFAEQGGEGVTADDAGNVYIAAGEIYVYNSAGQPLRAIHVPERPTQLLFGGADHRTLFITARTSLYAIHL